MNIAHAFPQLRAHTLILRVVVLTLPLSQLFSQVDERTARTPEQGSTQILMTQPQVNATVEMPVSDSTYIVGPGDELGISIFGSSFYSNTGPVNSDGTIVLPGIGKLYIRYATLREVRDRMYELLKKEVNRADILVNLTKARQIKVTVSGMIRNPGIIVLPSTARVSEVLELAGGPLKDTTCIRNIVVHRINNQNLTADLLRYFRLGDLDANPFVSGGDNVHFLPTDERVGVLGAVGKQGWIDHVPGETLYDVIALCQGLRKSAFLDSIEIDRFESDHVSTFKIFRDLRGYPNRKEADIELQAGDIVLVREIPKYHRHQLVLLSGEVKHQGSYSIKEGETTLLDLINSAGGLTGEASLEEAIVTRRPPENERDREFERLQKISAADMQDDEYAYFKARSRERVGRMVVNFKKLFLHGDSSQNILLRDGDLIEIPKTKNYVRVIGSVIDPGNVIYNKDWLYMDYIDAVGGFGWRADEGDARIVKAMTGEQVDASDEDTYNLEPGDVIWIPEKSESNFWEVMLVALGIMSQIAGVVGIVVAISRL